MSREPVLMQDFTAPKNGPAADTLRQAMASLVRVKNTVVLPSQTVLVLGCRSSGKTMLMRQLKAYSKHTTEGQKHEEMKLGTQPTMGYDVCNLPFSGGRAQIKNSRKKYE